jgi:NADPH:quinone reductase-like Zn-dependent oxidoreductase
MKAIVVTDEAAGTAGMTLVERPEPEPAINDVVVQVHASGFTSGELTWPSTWTDRVGRDRTPSIPGQELAGVVAARPRLWHDGAVSGTAGVRPH